jgi:predicted RecB family nuclease
MKMENSVIRLSATDLSSHLTCDHITTLNHCVAMGSMRAPDWANPDAVVLQQLGIEHERRYLDHLAASGLSITDLSNITLGPEAASETLSAMQAGTQIIVQAGLSSGRWIGRADVLRRVSSPSNLGCWSYEVYDCKLSRETKAATILQLCLYSEFVEIIQGITPFAMYVVRPSETIIPEKFSVLEFAAYYRLIKAKLEKAIAEGRTESTTYPEPNPQCDVCRWWKRCNGQWLFALQSGDSSHQRELAGRIEVTDARDGKYGFVAVAAA